jgi:RNA polymerase sigma-70 factor (ECF subfamily)
MKNLSNTLWALRGGGEVIDWDLVYESQLPRIFNYFLYKVDDRDLAQDLAATTFERAWRLRLRYRVDIATVPTWLFGIARNIMREHLRGALHVSESLDTAARIENMPARIDIEESVQQQQEKEHLRTLLHQLTERERDLIALKYGARLTNREIARVMGLSESNVGSILHRAVMELRRRWQHEHGR